MAFFLSFGFIIAFLVVHLEGYPETGHTVKLSHDFENGAQLHSNCTKDNNNSNTGTAIIKGSEEKIKSEVINSSDEVNSHTILQDYKWDKYVPYTIQENMYKRLQKDIEDAVAHWNSIFRGCIEFLKWKTEKDYIEFIEDSSCYGNIGRGSGRQVLALQKDHCRNLTKISHEMIHAIGIDHEHQRPDRDEYVKIRFDRIPQDLFPDFEKTEFKFEELKSIPYDYYSIVHYPVIASYQSKPTIEILKHIDEAIVGYARNFSSCDVVKVKSVYCPNEINNTAHFEDCISYAKDYGIVV